MTATLPWLTRAAACLGSDVDFFSDHPDDRREAKALCRACPLMDACLEHALAHFEFGIWGGTSEDDRKRLGSAPSARRYVDHGTEAGAQQHRRLGQQPCPPCAEAARLATRLRHHRLRGRVA